MLHDALRRGIGELGPSLRRSRVAPERFDGFIGSEDEYVQQRIRLQMELEQLTPITDNELDQAADLLANFKQHWDRLAGNDEARHDLVKLIVDRVYVQDKSLVAMTLHSNYHLVLNHKTNGPTEFSVDPLVFTHGSDGGRHRSGHQCLIFPFEAGLVHKFLGSLVDV